MEKEKSISLLDQSRQKFELACKDAASLQLVNNFGAAFTAVNVVSMLRDALTDEVMKQVFMPLMNTKIGFLTDRTGKPNKNGQVAPLYGVNVVRDAIIDAVTIGLLPTGNQMNIIAERMYPTKEGYTNLLKKIGVKYILDIGYDKGQNQNFAEIPVKISYEHNGEKNAFTVVATVKKDSYSSHDQLRGKAERRAKKTLYEYITGCDFGDGDPDSSVSDIEYEDVSEKVATEKKENANKATISMDNAQKSEEPKEKAAEKEQQTDQGNKGGDLFDGATKQASTTKQRNF